MLADHAVSIKFPDGSERHRAVGYADTLASLHELPGWVGIHLAAPNCAMKPRERALRDASEKPDDEAIAGITKANHEAAQWMAVRRSQLDPLNHQ